MEAKKPRKKPQTGVILPPDLLEWLREQAKQNLRSLSSEIVYRLRMCQEKEQ